MRENEGTELGFDILLPDSIIMPLRDNLDMASFIAKDGGKQWIYASN